MRLIPSRGALPGRNHPQPAVDAGEARGDVTQQLDEHGPVGEQRGSAEAGGEHRDLPRGRLRGERLVAQEGGDPLLGGAACVDPRQHAREVGHEPPADRETSLRAQEEWARKVGWIE